MTKSPSSSLSSSSEFDKKAPNIITKIEIAMAMLICIGFFSTLFWYSQMPAMGIQALAKLGIIFVFPTTMQVVKGAFALLGGISVTTAMTVLYHGIRIFLDLLSNFVDYLRDKYDEYNDNNELALKSKLSALLDKTKQTAKDHLPSVPVTWHFPYFFSKPETPPTPEPVATLSPSKAPGSPRKH